MSDYNTDIEQEYPIDGNERAERMLKYKDQQIEALEEEVAALKARINELMEELGEKKELANDFRDELEDKDNEIQQLKSALIKAYYRDARFHPDESQEMVKRARIFFENN
jgi:chromosome segregation ATPase